MKRRYFRADAAFALPEVYEFLEVEGYGYAIQLPINAVLQRSIAHLLTRGVCLNDEEKHLIGFSGMLRAATNARSRADAA
jgi:hypothetical protein